jgi:hypothetical protein
VVVLWVEMMVVTVLVESGARVARVWLQTEMVDTLGGWVVTQVKSNG